MTEKDLYVELENIISTNCYREEDPTFLTLMYEIKILSIYREKSFFFFFSAKIYLAPNNKTMAARKMRISFLSVLKSFVVQMHSYTMFSWGIIWIEWNGNTQAMRNLKNWKFPKINFIRIWYHCKTILKFSKNISKTAFFL